MKYGDLISRNTAIVQLSHNKNGNDDCDTIVQKDIETIKTLPSAENKGFDGMTNKEIISEFVERDDSFAIMVDEVNGTINIELSLDFWNSPYQKGGEDKNDKT